MGVVIYSKIIITGEEKIKEKYTTETHIFPSFELENVIYAQYFLDNKMMMMRMMIIIYGALIIQSLMIHPPPLIYRKMLDIVFLIHIS